MINAAMVGLGRWGQTVLGSIQGKNDRIRIVHGVTKEPELARELAAKHGFRLSTDLKDAIADPEVQAILLATPHSLHVEQVRMVAAAGKLGGLDEAAVQACLQDKPKIEAFTARVQASVDKGVTATPTFFFNGVKVKEGPMTPDELDKAYAAALKPAKK